MLNPMLGMVNQNRLTGMMAPIKNIMNMVRSAGNPQEMMAQMAQQNPNYQQAMQIVQQNGGDAQKAFYNFANQMGIDPQQIVNALK